MPLGNETAHRLDGLTVTGGLAVADTQGNLASCDYARYSSVARAAVLQRGLGVYAETFPLSAAAGSTIQVSGTIYGVAVGLLAGDVVTNISCRVVTLGSSFSGNGVKLGLYSRAGSLLASSVDVNASFGSTGVKTVAMQTPYTVTTDDVYYAAMISIAGTPPTILRGQSNSNSSGALGNGVSPMVNQTGQTDLNASATLANSGTAIAYWFAIT